MSTLTKQISEWAVDYGFEQCGVAAIEPLDVEYQRFERWVADGCHGTMHYLERYADIRHHPELLLPEAHSMVVVLMNYYPAERQPAAQPTIATYAYGADYHYVVRRRLDALASKINAVAPHRWAVYADSAPIMERTWAVRAGLGWIGRSGMLVNPRLGTYSLIGVMITTLALEASVPMMPHCGTCRRCLDACPTAAIHDTGCTVDARRCLSYLTIENREPVPDEFLPSAGNTLYGCDRCMEVCPWNRFAHPTTVSELQPIDGLFSVDWHSIGRGQFDRMFRYSAIQRAGFQKIRTRARQIFDSSHAE